MKTDVKKLKNENEAIIDQYDYLANAASSQDCTGLVPANPLPGDLMDAYEDVYHYTPPKLDDSDD